MATARPSRGPFGLPSWAGEPVIRWMSIHVKRGLVEELMDDQMSPLLADNSVGGLTPVFGPRHRPRFDADTLSSIRVMACLDTSPVMIAFSVAHRLGGISQEEVIDLVKGRRELFRFWADRDAR